MNLELRLKMDGIKDNSKNFGFKRGIHNRFTFGNEKEKEYSPLDYYPEANEGEWFKHFREESIKNHKRIHEIEEIANDYSESFDEIIKAESGEDEVYEYLHFVNSIRSVEHLKKYLNNEINFKKNEHNEYDEYEFDLMFKRLDKAIELINDGYRIEVWQESRKDGEELFVETFDIIFYIDRKDILNQIRNYSTNKNIAVVDYNKIDSFKNKILKDDNYNTCARNTVIISLVSYGNTERGSFLTKKYLKQYFTTDEINDIYNYINHQELDFDNYAMLVCTPLNSNVCQYESENSIVGHYVSLFDIYNLRIVDSCKYLYFLEFRGNEVDEYLKEFANYKFSNNVLFTDDIEKDLQLFFHTEDGEVYIIPQNRELIEDNQLGVKIDYDVSIYYLCGTKYGIAALSIKSSKDVKLKKIEDFFNNESKQHYIKEYLKHYFDGIDDDVKINVLGNGYNYSEILMYSNNLSSNNINSTGYFSLYSKGILQDLNSKLKNNLINHSNNPDYKMDTNVANKFIRDCEAEYAIVSLLKDQSNYDNKIDFNIYEKVNKGIRVNDLENLFNRNIMLFRELANFEGKSTINNLTLVLSTVSTANSLLSFLTLYISIVTNSLRDRVPLYLMFVIFIQAICVIISITINIKLSKNK